MSSKSNDKRQIALPKSVDISAIDKELSDLWAVEAQRVTGWNEPPIARICTLNLLVYTRNRNDLDTARGAVDIATNDQPLKVIMLLAEDGQEDGTSSSEISGYCRLVEGGGIQVCCEQITLQATGTQASEIASSASELLSPDLPVALWWTDDIDVSDDSFKQLESVSDRLIFDSLNMQKPVEGMSRMMHLAEDHRNTALSDLNWLRITPWRESIANFFDPKDMRAHLYEISHINIEYACGSDINPLQALMIAGWMSSLLQWHTVSSHYDATNGRITAKMIDMMDKSIDLVIKPVEVDMIPPGHLASVKLTYGISHIETTISHNPEKPILQIESRAGESEVSRQEYRYKIESTGEMLADEITSISADAVYYRSLMAANHLAKNRINM